MTDDELAEVSFSDHLLPDWYDDWVTVERERFRQLRLHALEALAARYVELGRFAEAVEMAQLAVTAEPIRESAHRVLIEAHLPEGNTGEALRQYHLFRELLNEELGLSPSPRIRELLAGLPV